MGAESLPKAAVLRTSLRARCWLAAGGLAVGWLAAGCDSGSFPVAPGGALAVRAVPSTITATGSSTIEVLASENGLPLRAGTEVRVTTTLGRIVDEVIATDGNGLAFTTLEADGRLGSATVTARSGRATAGTATVTIGAASLKADFSCSGTELTVIFSYKHAEGAANPNAWSWDFGDGGTSSEKDPVHTYGAAGSYLTTLTVSNEGGEDSASKFVTVTDTGGSC